ncbi:hypothetical protein [Kitasatospora sp. NPDC056184]
MNDWTVWGVSSTPYAENLTREQAANEVERRRAAGDDDVYAENTEGDVIE